MCVWCVFRKIYGGYRVLAHLSLQMPLCSLHNYMYCHFYHHLHKTMEGLRLMGEQCSYMYVLLIQLYTYVHYIHVYYCFHLVEDKGILEDMWVGVTELKSVSFQVSIITCSILISKAYQYLYVTVCTCTCTQV